MTKKSDEERRKAIAAIHGCDPSEVILGPSRTELIEDGALVDVSKLASEAGFLVPVALTRGAWDRHVAVPDGDTSGQDETGRLWDVLHMASCQAYGAGDRWRRFVANRGISLAPKKRGAGRITFGVISSAVNARGKLEKAVEVQLDLALEGGDVLEPVMTIALPGED